MDFEQFKSELQTAIRTVKESVDARDTEIKKHGEVTEKTAKALSDATAKLDTLKSDLDREATERKQMDSRVIELEKQLQKVGMGQLHEALGEPAMFAIGNRKETPACLVEQAVNAALEGTFAEAEALLLQRFSAITLADLAADFARRHTAARRKGT